jgi:hypothetical protein
MSGGKSLVSSGARNETLKGTTSYAAVVRQAAHKPDQRTVYADTCWSLLLDETLQKNVAGSSCHNHYHCVSLRNDGRVSIKSLLAYHSPSPAVPMFVLYCATSTMKALRLTTATSPTILPPRRPGLVAIPVDGSLSVPGDSPLQYCTDPGIVFLTIESVDIDPSPPLPYVSLLRCYVSHAYHQLMSTFYAEVPSSRSLPKAPSTRQSTKGQRSTTWSSTAL